MRSKKLKRNLLITTSALTGFLFTILVIMLIFDFNQSTFKLSKLVKYIEKEDNYLSVSKYYNLDIKTTKDTIVINISNDQTTDSLTGTLANNILTYEIAKDEDAEILVLNVVDSKHLTSLPEDALTDEALSVFEKQSEVVTERVVKQIEEIDSDFATKVSTLSVEGNPVDAILKVSEKKDIDLIVIASSGKHMLDRFLLGSVTEKTIRYSKVPVLVIPTTEK